MCRLKNPSTPFSRISWPSYSARHPLTKAIMAGTFQRSLAPAASLTITVKIAVSLTVKLKATRSALLIASSSALPLKDVVLAEIVAG